MSLRSLDGVAEWLQPEMEFLVGHARTNLGAVHPHGKVPQLALENIFGASEQLHLFIPAEVVAQISSCFGFPFFFFFHK